MELALAEGRRGLRLGEIPIGAVILNPAGKILASATNLVETRHDPSAHAEIIALRQAGRQQASHRLSGCLLITTLEPCLMCAAAIMGARLAGVIYGAADPLAGAITSTCEYFDQPSPRARIWHLGGILASECAGLLENFFNRRRHAHNPLPPKAPADTFG